jgi:hypothetical protein
MRGVAVSAVSEDQLEELGPIDYMVLEWAGDQPVTGEFAGQKAKILAS